MADRVDRLLRRALAHAARVHAAWTRLGRCLWAGGDGSRCYVRRDGADTVMIVSGGDGCLVLVLRHGGIDPDDLA